MAAAVAVPTTTTMTAVAATMTAGIPIAVTLGGGWFGDGCQTKAQCERSQASDE